MSEQIRAFCGIGLAGLGVTFVGLALVNMFLMVRHRQEGVEMFSRRLFGNPFNLVFVPSLLTEKGLKARRRFVYFTIGFLAVVVVVVLAAVVGLV